VILKRVLKLLGVTWEEFMLRMGGNERGETDVDKQGVISVDNTARAHAHTRARTRAASCLSVSCMPALTRRACAVLALVVTPDVPRHGAHAAVH
jgi:hypothetical protein